jgi:hypothetical protein
MSNIKPWMIIVGALLLLLIIGGGSCYGTMNSIQQEGVAQETALSAQYLDNQNELSSYKASFYEQIGVANLKSEKMDQILEDAVKGRYDGNSSAQPDRGQLFSAIVEAYPDLKGLDIFDKIVDHIRAGREAYKQKQSKLLDMLRAYDRWRGSGIIHSRLVKMAGFPSEHLEARIGTSVKRGAEARDQMYLIVTTADTKKAYETGTDEPLQVPGNDKK